MNDEMSEIEKAAIDNPKVEELANWKNNHVYTEVEDKNQKLLEKIKFSKQDLLPEALKMKKLRGYNITDSTILSKESLHIVLTIMSINGWNCHSLDVKTPLLQGNQINCNIFIKPPKEANVQGLIWKLIYGLSDASRA